MAHSESVDNRDDLPRTRESVDPIRATDAHIRFAFGTSSSAVFREIAETLTAARLRAGAAAPGTAARGTTPLGGQDSGAPVG